MPFVRFLASKRYLRLVLLILSFSKIMPSCSYYVEKRLSYIMILVLFSRQSSSYAKCTRTNILSSYNIYLVSTAKYMRFIYSYILQSLRLPYLIYYRVLRSGVHYEI